jgi:hypothetical protein
VADLQNELVGFTKCRACAFRLFRHKCNPPASLQHGLEKPCLTGAVWPGYSNCALLPLPLACVSGDRPAVSSSLRSSTPDWPSLRNN